MELHDEESTVPSHMEIAHLVQERGGPHPGIHLFTQVSMRFVSVQSSRQCCFPLLPSAE